MDPKIPKATSSTTAGSRKQQCSKIRQKIREAIAQIDQTQATLDHLIEQLKTKDISVSVNLENRQIAYHCDKIRVTGGKLGNLFSVKGLEKQGIILPLKPDRNLKPTQAPPIEFSQWKIVQAQLEATYHLPSDLLKTLSEEKWLYADSKARAVFIERTLDNDTNHALILAEDGFFHPFNENIADHPHSCFWVSTSEPPFKRAVILDDPLEVLSIYALEESQNVTTTQQTLYISARRRSQLPLDILKKVETIYVSESCLSPVKNILKKQCPWAKRIHPRNVESWRGVWQDYWHLQQNSTFKNYYYRPRNRQQQQQR